VRCCPQEQLRTVGVVDPVVERAASGAARLLDAGLTAALVRHAGRPHLLDADRGENRRPCVDDRLAGGERVAWLPDRIGRAEQLIDGQRRWRLDDGAVGIEQQPSRGGGHPDDVHDHRILGAIVLNS
jgi:hypothetical protein